MIRNKKAIALRYNPKKENAPVVVAKGENDLAEVIIDIANRLKIPVHEDDLLSGALAQIPLGGFIPKDLYEVIAILFAELQRIGNKKN